MSCSLQRQAGSKHPSAPEGMSLNGLLGCGWGVPGGAELPGSLSSSCPAVTAAFRCCRDTMAPYTIPTELIVVEEIPRNQMGKVNKKELLKRFYPA